MYRNILILFLILTLGLLTTYMIRQVKKDIYKIRIDTLGKQNNKLHSNLKEFKIK